MRKIVRIMFLVFLLLFLVKSLLAQYPVVKMPLEMSDSLQFELIKKNLIPINDSVGVFKTKLYFYYFDSRNYRCLAFIEFETKNADFMGVYGFDYWVMINEEVNKKNKSEIRQAIKDIDKNIFTKEKANLFFASVIGKEYD
jgi:hypothetical protein